MNEKTLSQTFEREMTISHKDFFRILPKAVKGHSYREEDNHIIVSLGEDAAENAGNVQKEPAEIHITLAKEGRLNIASLSLPSTKVTFDLKNVAEKTKKEFFHHFDRSYQRGGG